MGEPTKSDKPVIEKFEEFLSIVLLCYVPLAILWGASSDKFLPMLPIIILGTILLSIGFARVIGILPMRTNGH